ncbi:MAG: hypothetical protein U5K36_04635 [Roseovarius sp.]|nr:hypothetical protein [Roseovarius sp.]
MIARLAAVRPGRRLLPTAALTLLPAPALADACATLRPGWPAGTQATEWTEALYHFSSVPALILLIATALTIRFRSQWGGLAVTVFWSAFVALIVWGRFGDDPAGLRKSAIEEGCLGSPTLFIAAVTAICIATILYTAPNGRQTSE